MPALAAPVSAAAAAASSWAMRCWRSCATEASMASGEWPPSSCSCSLLSSTCSSTCTPIEVEHSNALVRANVLEWLYCRNPKGAAMVLLRSSNRCNPSCQHANQHHTAQVPDRQSTAQHEQGQVDAALEPVFHPSSFCLTSLSRCRRASSMGGSSGRREEGVGMPPAASTAARAAAAAACCCTSASRAASASAW